ncbi:MAG: 3-oxoacyl-[acyl-carrier-protein] reductase [Vicinamibacteria bacterium]|nr:3-oxoacyl-[acyl-carrier-protein] reductase [Vicinamibacteria bacterium]
MDLKGKVSIITGAGQGIGKAVALELARSGSDVAVVDVNLDQARQTAEEINALGVRSLSQKVDVSDFEAVVVAVKEVAGGMGRIDILVNNAGVTRDALILRMKPEDWDFVLGVNLKGTFNYTAAVLPKMVKQRGGSIVNVASIMGLVGNAGQANYSASKAGVIGLTRTTAKEVASRGINVNAVAPGFIESAMTRKMPEAARDEILKRIPMGRTGQPADVAAAVLFLASDMARYITGHVLVVDGGLVE